MHRVAAVTGSVRNKLFAGFAVVVVCALVLGLVSMNKLASTNAATAYIAKNSLPSLKVTALARNAATQLRADQASYLSAPPALRSGLAASISRDAAVVNNQSTFYFDKLLTDARDKANTTAVRGTTGDSRDV